MDKVLKPYTIVPPQLYVQRDADRQLRNIISDMGRPGYVLVSRQMGKTNLLLNAKHSLENNDDIFLYIDLSNSFEDARSCFENIIDTAIEINSAKFASVIEPIHERRSVSENIPAHKQHISELRLLLSCIKGKLVIILDEIDALAKTDYSDLIFAQIRSIYFSRVNFKELEKLTYILSGVIEPIDIIKDPKISPFNIGQKIYLNDFSRSEFDRFISNSGLQFEENITNRIYFWTNGNPRITWDLCSELENVSDRSELTTNLVDSVVSELYLTSFDKPPVDNIRELVIEDREIRNALIEIFYNKGSHIQDKVKNKLYLAGIVNYVDKKIEIKNEIIRRSLTHDWIKSLERQDKEILQMALEFYKNEQYEDSIKLFEEFLVENEFDSEFTAIHYFYLGEACYHINKFEKAVHFLSQANFDLEDNPLWYYRTQNILGSTFYRLGRIPESLEKLKIIVESGRRDSEYARGLINYGITLMKSSEISQQNEAVSIFKKIVDEATFNSNKIPADFVELIRSIALNYLARIQVKLGEISDARINYRKSINSSDIRQKAPIILALYDITEEPNEKGDLLCEVVDILESDNSWNDGLFKIASNEFSIDDLKYLFVVILALQESILPRVLRFVHFLGSKPVAEKLFDNVVSYLERTNDLSTTSAAIESLFRNFENLNLEFSTETKYSVLKFRALLSDVKISRNKLDDYFRFYSVHQPKVVDQQSFDLFAGEIYRLIEEQNFSKALRYLNLIISRKANTPNELVINFIVIHNLELSLYTQLNDRIKLVQVALTIIELSMNISFKGNNESLLSEKGLRTVIDNAESILVQEGYSRSKRSEKVYSRNQFVNVRFKDGKIYKIKYKKIERSLMSGECFIID